ncbi:MAG: hypothetical protein QN178_02500 [Armatimonadota bacterium]|nr:hypothetical protein [Armatimonadota bacterium]
MLDYFRAKPEIMAGGHLPLLERNYMDKHAVVNATARALTEHRVAFVDGSLKL